MKKAVSVLLAAALLFVFSGCIFDRDNPFPYRGEYAQLYTAAVYSIPDAEGYMHHGEGAFDSEIYIWEQDDYGRILFSYCEDYGDQVFGLVLCQAYDETNVYFYPDVNYVLTYKDSQSVFSHRDKDHLKNKTEDLYLENRDILKEANDWNQPLDKSKCASYAISDHKALGENIYSFSSAQCDKIINEYTKTLNLSNPSNTPHRYNSILQVDAEGKILHEIYGVHQYHDNPDRNAGDEYTSYSIVLWVITDKDGNYDKENGIMVMYSKANESGHTFVYDASAVLEFKTKNGWKNPESAK